MPWKYFISHGRTRTNKDKTRTKHDIFIVLGDDAVMIGWHLISSQNRLETPTFLVFRNDNCLNRDGWDDLDDQDDFNLLSCTSFHPVYPGSDFACPFLIIIRWLFSVLLKVSGWIHLTIGYPWAPVIFKCRIAGWKRFGLTFPWYWYIYNNEVSKWRTKNN
jgi:hypothetical protein